MRATRTLPILACLAALACTASRARADFTFGEPVNLRSIIPGMDPLHEDPTCLSYDGLEMYIESDRAGGVGGFDLWVLRRTATDEDWGPPENLGTSVNTAKNEGGASISADGLTLYFNSDIGRQWPDIYMTTRASRDAPWGSPVSLGPKVNTGDGNGGPWISPDGLELFFWSYVSGGYGRSDLYVLRRATLDDPWGDPVNLGPLVNTTTEDISPCLSPDGLLLFFSDNFAWGDPPRPGGCGGTDIWITRRATVSSAWQTPVNLGLGVNSSMHDFWPRISPDGSTLYFVTGESMDFTTWENWQAPIVPIVDFNGDGRVDAADMALLVDNWGKDQPLCDIGPFAWGDGIVDAQDLAVLSEHMDVRGPAVAHAPGANATEVPCDVVLTWTPGDFAQTHDVYFGTSWDAVLDANRTSPLDVLVSRDQEPNAYDPLECLEFGQTYYWRVDEIGAAPDFTIYRGPVLSFTTEAYAYPIGNIVATASSSQPGMGPEKTVDGSGLDAGDGHSTTPADMWTSRGVTPNWITYEFDGVCVLHELWVWNSNQAIEPFLGFGAKSVTIEYSIDGTTWATLDGVPEFARAPGKPGYVANTKVSFSGVSAQFVRLTIDSTWGAIAMNTGLSEVRFFYIPVRPYAPVP